MFICWKWVFSRDRHLHIFGKGKKNPAHAPAVWVTVKRTQGRDAFGKAYQSDVLTFGSPFPPSSVTTDTEDLETEGRRETG